MHMIFASREGRALKNIHEFANALMRRIVSFRDQIFVFIWLISKYGLALYEKTGHFPV